MGFHTRPSTFSYMSCKDDRFLRSTVGNKFTAGRKTHSFSKLYTGTWFYCQRSTLQHGKVLIHIPYVVSSQCHILINHTTDLLQVGNHHRELSFLTL